MRKYLVFIIFLLVLVIAALGGIFWYFSQTAAPSANSEEKRFVITKGSSATKIANDLEEAGLVKSALAFKVYTQINGISDSIPPGQFLIPQNLNTEELIGLLREGPTELWVTIPEGVRREQIPAIFAKALELSSFENEKFNAEFLEASVEFEGYLYPDTYLFPPEVSAAQVVSLLRNTFNKKFAPSKEELVGIGLTLNEVVTLASILERETLTPEERPVVAGIYFNRLSVGWPLQADATVQYALGTNRCRGQIECAWWQPPTRDEIDNLISPFNTYKNTGIPPSPISNPGLTSLRAIISPEETEYWYYIHDADGVIHYAKTLEEHNANISRYLR